MKHLYFVRHGESEFNKASEWVGSSDSPLTTQGESQAKATGKMIGAKNLKIDLIVSSPLGRALDTAKIIAQEISYPLEKIIRNELFVERNFGVLDGKLVVQAETNYAKDESAVDQYEGVESLVDLQKRAKKALNYLESLPQQSVMVASHGAIGRAIRREIRKEGLHVRGQPFEYAMLEKLI